MFTSLLSLVRRQPFITTCIAITVLACAGAAWMLQTAAGYDTELEHLTDDGSSILNLIATRSVLERELDLVRLAVNRTEDNLVVEDNLAENLWYFYSIESRTQTRLTDLRQLDSPPPAANALYRRIPYELRVTGEFVRVSEFLRQLEIGPRLMRVRDFSLRRDQGGRPNLTLDLSIDLLGRK